ncbi:uncharacterized protein LOC111400372 [Olea europaea var. sylvestris]|uniref:uncharacterized protein LOC111400372 n=1 Tax=Olea europaea var. sylvestris TaxID=158386 RepID=UPI000C1D312E|nr:uncharacterized protein LOC111400372 [Olea europaea var. sylvestris]
MGNVALCYPSMISSGVVKVLSTDGRIMIYTRAVKTAELMLEHPGVFLCNSCHLKIGQRISGVSADEELERGQFYFLLPMEMLYSVLTNEEMNCLNDKASKGHKQGSLNFSKIFPVLGDHFCLFPNSEAKALKVSSASDSQPSERYSRQRSWEPALETIVETPPRH